MIRRIISWSENHLFSFAALSTVIVVFICYLFSGFNIYYSENDDYAIAYLFTKGETNSVFLNYFLSAGLVFLQKVFSAINVFVLFQLVFNFFSLLLINYLLLSKFNFKFGLLMIAAVGVFLGGEAFVFIQWTQTAAIGCAAGYAAIYYIFTAEKHIKHKKLMCIFSVIFILLSSWLRFAVFISVTAIFIVAVICDTVIKCAKHINNNQKSPIKSVAKKQLSLFVISVAVIASVFATNICSDAIKSLSSVYQAYKNYNTARARVNDYAVLPYEGNEEFYNSKGIFSQNELKMFSSWHTDDAKFNTETLNDIGDNSASQKPKIMEKVLTKINQYTSINPYVILFSAGVLILVIAIIIFIFRNKLKLLFPLILVIMWFCYFLVFRFSLEYILALPIAATVIITSFLYNRYHYIFSLAMSFSVMALTLYFKLTRINFRSTFTVFCPVFLFILLSLNKENLRNRVLCFAQGRKGLLVITVLMVMASLVFSSYRVVMTGAIPRYDFDNDVYEYIEANSNKLFVVGCPEVKISGNYNSPLYPPKKPSNVLVQSGWGVGSQSYNEIKCEYEIENTYKDIIDNDRAYFVDKSSDVAMIEKYFNDFYSTENCKIVFKEIKKFDSICVYSIVTEQI